jgi:hypothetical protein
MFSCRLDWYRNAVLLYVERVSTSEAVGKSHAAGFIVNRIAAFTVEGCESWIAGVFADERSTIFAAV